MSVLVRHHAAGMDADTYDQVSSQLIPKLKEQPGFMYHVAYPSGNGMIVSEIWESQEQHDSWFDENVKPQVPADMEVEVLDVHSVVTP